MKAVYTEEEFIKRAKIVLKDKIDKQHELYKKEQKGREELQKYLKARNYKTQNEMTSKERTDFVSVHGGSFNIDLQKSLFKKKEEPYSYDYCVDIYDAKIQRENEERIPLLRNAIGAAIFAEKVELAPEDYWMIASEKEIDNKIEDDKNSKT